MRFNKFLSIFLVAVTLLSLTGCGKQETPVPSTEAPTIATVVTEPPLSPEEQEALRVSEAVLRNQSENSFTFLAFADSDPAVVGQAEAASALVQKQVTPDFVAYLDNTTGSGDLFQDLETFKTRVITLQTAEDTVLSAQQLQQFAEALDLSGKTDAQDWGILILSHLPLDYGNLLDSAGRILDSYLSGTVVSILPAEDAPEEALPVEYDFTGKNSAEIIGNIHGFTCCLQADNLYLAKDTGTMYRSPIVRICIPNMGVEGNNRFGINGTADSNGIEYGEAETYGKVNGTENAIAFNVVTVDREAKVIHCVNYGAGYDREVPYASGLLAETPVSGTPAPEGAYINQVPISTEFGRYNKNLFNEVGYRNHTYLVCNDIDEEAAPYGHDAQYVTTGAIPFTVPSYRTPPVVYIWGATLDEDDHTRFFIYDSQKYRLVLQATGSEFKNYFTIDQLGDQYYRLTPIPDGKDSMLFPATNGRAGRGSIAFSLKGTGENLVITVGEPIIPESTDPTISE